MRYIALLGGRRSVENPASVVRIDDGREEIYVPGRGWEACDPLYREWIENVAITEEQALAALPHLQPLGPLEKMDPEHGENRMFAHEGYYPDTHYYAVETAEHPFDDPLTVVLRQWLTGKEWSYTTNLAWEGGTVEGRRIRISKEAADQFKKIQALRVCGDTTYRYYAITNPLQPNADDPALVARALIGQGAEAHEHYERGWVRSSAIYDVSNGFSGGTLVEIRPETAAGLLRPRTPPRTRYFRCRTKSLPHTEVLVRARPSQGGLRVAELHDDGWYVGDMDVYLRDYDVTEIDEPDEVA